jgi:hypothetical protein
MPNFQNVIFLWIRHLLIINQKRLDNTLKKTKILIPIYLPTASPEFMVMEEIWNIAKRDLLVLQYYQSFADFKEKISRYFRTKRFGLDMRNYLLIDVW